MPTHNAMLIYDGDCAFCETAAQFTRDRTDETVVVTPWQMIDSLDRYGLTEEDVSTAAYWVDYRNRTYRGHLAVAQTFKALGLPWSLFGNFIALPVIRTLADPIYRVIAKNRHRLPGASDACKIDFHAIDADSERYASPQTDSVNASTRNAS